MKLPEKCFELGARLRYRYVAVFTVQIIPVQKVTLYVYQYSEYTQYRLRASKRNNDERQMKEYR
jgi:hypothetical protein